MGGATYVDASVLGVSPEDEKAEEADGEAALQGGALEDLLRVQQPVALEVSQRPGLMPAITQLPEEPDHRLHLRQQHTALTMRQVSFLFKYNRILFFLFVRQTTSTSTSSPLAIQYK